MKRRAFLATSIAGAAASQTACQYVPAASTPNDLEPPGAFELDEVSLADLAAGLEKGKWTSARLVDLYIARIEAVDRNDAVDRSGPKLGAVLALNPDAAAIAGQLDQERKERPPARPAARHSHPRQGQHRNARPHQHHRRFARARRLARPPRRRRCRSPARRRRHHPRQNQSQRMGQFPLHPLHQRMERTRRSNQKPLRSRSQSLRLQLRLGRWRRRQSLRRGHRQRNRWIGHQPVIYQRPRRHQTHRRTRQPHRHHPHLGQPGHRRPHGPHRPRRRHSAERDGGVDPPADPEQIRARLHAFSRSQRSARRAPRHRPQILREQRASRRVLERLRRRLSRKPAPK